MEKLSRLSTPIFDDVTCVEIDPIDVEAIIFIFCGPKHVVVSMQVLSIIGGNMIPTFTTKHKMRVIHVCNNPLNHFRTGDN